jgi:Tfp pilus assembly protein PilO
MPREFRTQFILSIGITLAVLIVIGTLMFYLRNDLAIKSKEIAQINQHIVDKTNAIKNLDDLQQEQPIATPLFTKMSAAISSQDRLFSVRQNFQAVAKNNNLAFSSGFGSETDATTNVPGRVAIEMTLQGSYNNILAFLKSIESNTGFISVSNIDLIEQPTGGNFTAIITGNIPFYE